MISPLSAIRELEIPFDGDVFHVELGMPRDARGIVYLLRDNGNVVHGNALAFALRERRFGTAICQLLTDAERAHAASQRKAPLRAELLTLRLKAVIDVVSSEADLGALPAGIAASGIAAGAALHVAALRPLAFDAIACRHAQIESLRSLQYVRPPTLFLAVAGDLERIRPMTQAFQQLQCTKHFEIVSGDSPSFDDERSFLQASELTTEWMQRHLGRAAAAGSMHPDPTKHPSGTITVPPHDFRLV